MKKVNEVEVEGEKILLRKDILGWHRVYPNKDENGKIIWKNLIAGGSWFRLFLVAIIVILIVLAINEYRQAVTMAYDCVENSCKYCSYILSNFTGGIK
jgi:hypothetical protein